jgi:hypothetical protein
MTNSNSTTRITTVIPPTTIQPHEPQLWYHQPQFNHTSHSCDTTYHNSTTWVTTVIWLTTIQPYESQLWYHLPQFNHTSHNCDITNHNSTTRITTVIPPTTIQPHESQPWYYMPQFNHTSHNRDTTYHNLTTRVIIVISPTTIEPHESLLPLPRTTSSVFSLWQSRHWGYLRFILCRPDGRGWPIYDGDDTVDGHTHAAVWAEKWVPDLDSGNWTCAKEITHSCVPVNCRWRLQSVLPG